MNGAFGVVEVPKLIESTGCATDIRRVATVVLSQCRLDRREAVGRAAGGGDACIGKPSVGWKALEEINGTFEEVWDFFCWLVRCIAIGVQGADAGSVLATERLETNDTSIVERCLPPLVLPEGLC